MKRILAFACCFLLLFCSCATANPPVVSDFSCRVDFDVNDIQFAAKLERFGTEKTTLSILEPTTLKGLSLSCEAESYTASWLGMSFTLGSNEIPYEDTLRYVIEVLDSCLENYHSSDVSSINGTVSGIDYVLTYNPNTGYLETLSVPQIHLNLTFSQWKVPNEDMV